MATSAPVKYGVGLASGPITFSALRETFLLSHQRTTIGGSETFDAPVFGTVPIPVSASQLIRDSVSDNPNVPNATENVQITDSQNNLKASQFRNSIKFYYLGQSGTDTNYNIGAQNWNSNLNSSIVKRMFIDGSCNASSVGVAAARLVNNAKNITIDVNGGIYGAGGAAGGGGAGSTSLSSNGGPGNGGGDGGDALQVNASSNNVVVFVRSTSANIFGGGGGGAGGGGGGKGGTGNQGSYSYQCGTQCIHIGGFCHGCPGAYQTQYCGGHCNPALKRAGILFCACCQVFAVYCTAYTAGGVGGDGGAGGDGGTGRGAGSAQGSGSGGSTGAGGAAGGGSGAGAGGKGGDGGDGGNGGNWGMDGLPSNNSTNPGFAGARGGPSNAGGYGTSGGAGAQGGAGGESMTGAGYKYTGTINTSGSFITIRGGIIGGTQV